MPMNEMLRLGRRRHRLAPVMAALAVAIGACGGGGSDAAADAGRHDAAGDLLAVVDRDGFEGRRAQRLTGGEIELRAVQPAFDGASLHVTLGEGDLAVGAQVVDRMDPTVGVTGDADLVVVHFDAHRGSGGHLVGGRLSDAGPRAAWVAGDCRTVTR